MVLRSGSALLMMALVGLVGCGETAPPAPGTPAGNTPTAPTGRPQGMGPGMMPGGPGMGGPGMGGMGMGGMGMGTGPAEMVDQPLALTDGKATLSGENTKITFVGTKPGGQHEGGFKTLSGSVELAADGKSLASLTVEIDTESLWSDNGGLTNHLKNADFFDVKVHPKASFTTSAIATAEGGEATHTLTGDLTLHGVTKSISVPATVTLNEAGLHLKSTFKIDRQDFGITFDPSKVDAEVEIGVTVGVAPK